MARGINKVTLIGNLGQDPELRYTGNGTPVCTLRLATTDVYKDKEGQLVEKTEWHSVVAWSRLAEICGQYLRKGSKVYFDGSLQTRSWEGKDGNVRYTTEIRAKNMLMLDRNADGSQQNQVASTPRNQRSYSPQPAPAAATPSTPWQSPPQSQTSPKAVDATTPTAQTPSTTSDLQSDPLLDDLPF